MNENGLLVDLDQIDPILNYPVPMNIEQLRRFLGMASSYRKFINNFSTIAAPLNLLLKKKKNWYRSDDQQSAFEQIKEYLSKAPVLLSPDFNVPFVLQTDASSTGLGAVLTQTTDGMEHVISYASRSLSDAEKNYTTTEQECLAIIWAIQKFCAYLEGYHFTVITDHSSLRWLHNLKTPSGRLARWALSLLEYDYEIIHRKGSYHYVPDALSRMFGIPKEQINAINDVTPSWYVRRFLAISSFPERFPNWKIRDNKLYHFRPDPLITSLVRDLNEWKLVPPKEDRIKFFSEAHNVPQAGHLGTEKTYKRIAIDYFWPGCFKDVVDYVRKCDVCQCCKADQKASPGMMGKRIVEQPWIVVASDIMGPLPRSKSGYQYILVIQDLFTKCVECLPLRKATGIKIRDAFRELIINRWGTPQVIHTDNGTEFVNQSIQSRAKEYNSYLFTITTYHSQVNPVERINVIRSVI